MLHTGIGVQKDQRRAFDFYQTAGELRAHGWTLMMHHLMLTMSLGELEGVLDLSEWGKTMRNNNRADLRKLPSHDILRSPVVSSKDVFRRSLEKL